ncbi:MAG TPA: prolyl oligopeptidase family serine peptidase [Bryobacteraceae bacterium]|nr:prolyl oligopeptidase family serine peptidase [Bryobacteraceae bacterium]
MALRTAYLLVSTAFLCFSASGPLAPADLAGLHTISEARISPDGQWLAYVDAIGGHANLRLISLAGKPPISLGDGIWRDRSPRWSFESSRLAWLSENGGAVRILVRRMDSGAETVIANLPETPLSVALVPEGDALAFTARAPAQGPPPAWAPPELLPFLARPLGPIQVFVLASPSATPRQLSPDDFDAVGEPAWMLDGQTVLAARSAGQIFAFRLSGGQKVLSAHAGRNECPLPSPDGTKVAWLATNPKPSGYAIRKLWVMNADGSRVKILSGALDRDVSSPQWSSDSRNLYFLADDHGVTHAYAAHNDGTLRELTLDPARLEGLSLADNGNAATIRSTGSSTGEVVVFPADHPGTLRVVVSPNHDLLAGRPVGAVEEITWGSEGQIIQGWLTKPPGFQPAQKYPLLVDIRDASPSMCSGEFDLRSQIFAAHGFVVLCANPRGTPGYGEEFGNLLRTNFPGGAADDLLHGVDLVAAKGYIDPRRVAVIGGYVAAWLIGHTGRFQAAVARDPIVDWTMDAALDRDPARHAVAWMGALPWEDADQYVKHSPLYFAGSFQTPTLVIEHGDDPQAAELYFALQSRKVASALVRLPKAPQPAGRITELQAEIAWLARATAAPPPAAR